MQRGKEERKDDNNDDNDDDNDGDGGGDDDDNDQNDLVMKCFFYLATDKDCSNALNHFNYF